MNIEKMKRHLGNPVELRLGEDVFRIPPLPSEYIPDFIGGVVSNMGSAFQGVDMDDLENIKLDELLKSLSKDVMAKIRELIVITCQRSPDIDSSDKELLDQFVSANFMDLMSAVFEANSQTIQTTSDRTKKLLKRKIDKPTAEGIAADTVIVKA